MINKMKNRFLKIFLSLSILTTISFTAFAETKHEKLYYLFRVDYKNKGLEKDFKNNFKRKVYEMSFKNKTTAKEYVNLHLVMQKMFEKYNIPTDKKFKLVFTHQNYKRLNIATIRQNKIKLAGIVSIGADFSEKNVIEKLLENFNEDIKNIKITREDFENAKKTLINYHKNKIHELTNEIKDYEGKGLIEIGKIFAKKMLDFMETEEKIFNLEGIKQNKSYRFIIENCKLNKESYEDTLEDDKMAKERGKRTYKFLIKTNKEVLIPKAQEYIKQIENVKYEDVINLTKDLKIKLKDMKNGKALCL